MDHIIQVTYEHSSVITYICHWALAIVQHTSHISSSSQQTVQYWVHSLRMMYKEMKLLGTWPKTWHHWATNDRNLTYFNQCDTMRRKTVSNYAEKSLTYMIISIKIVKGGNLLVNAEKGTQAQWRQVSIHCTTIMVNYFS